MSEKIRIGDQWYVLATSARAEERLQVLKSDETFALFNRFGDIQPWDAGEQGLYQDDTRFLSRLEMLVNGKRPMYLGASVKENNSLLVVDLMNPDLERDGQLEVPKGTVHIFRAKLLWQGTCHEHIRLSNHGLVPVRLRVELHFEADYVDLFEVRGIRRERSGTLAPVELLGGDGLAFRYEGLDGVWRCTKLQCEPPPDELNATHASYDIELLPGGERHIYCTVACSSGEPGAAPTPCGPRLCTYQQAFRKNEETRWQVRSNRCAFASSNPLMDRWLERSLADLDMLTTELPSGPFPYAGVPWYSTTFGRDGLLTAHLCLWNQPQLARGVLAFLAATQATDEDAASDAEPGKILHEARRCEMARTREVPFGRYYGSVDSTPLFVLLAGAYWRRTGDLEFIRSLWPHITLALEWIDRYGDRDGDGFVEYARRSKDGLVQQGWKDSHDSIFHTDGRYADAPIALCEVQAYVYEAKRLAAELCAVMGEPERAQQLNAAATALRQRFQEHFWCDELGLYAIALDGDKQPCRVASSNAGHALWAGIAAPEHAARMAQRLFEEDMFSGWGLRTIGSGQSRYNPMSYHNGSIWPHDNALVFAGLARYGHTEAAMRLLDGMFEASLHFERHRLPELFCGFARRPAEGPTLYPVACSPQAWACAALFGMLQACLGLHCHARTRELELSAPRLPAFTNWLEIRGLEVAGAKVDLLLQRYRDSVGVEVTSKTGELAVRVHV